MATSGVFTWELNRDEIINAALRKIGVLGEGVSASATQITTGAEALNSMIMLFAVEDGLPLYRIVHTATAFVASTNTYSATYGLRVLQVLRKETASGSQIPLEPVSRYEFNQLNTSTTGLPNTYFVDNNIETPVVTVWPTPTATEAASHSIVIVHQKEVDSFDADVDTPAFPAYWSDALIYGLASRLAPEYGVPLEDRRVLMAEANAYKRAAMDYNEEFGSLYIQPAEH